MNYYPYGSWSPQQNTGYMPQQYVPQQQAMTPYIKVNSFDEVKAFNMPPNASALFLDVTKPYMYSKTTNAAGVAETEAFELNKVPIDQIGVPKVDLSNYVTVDKFDKSMSILLQKLDELKIEHPPKEELL